MPALRVYRPDVMEDYEWALPVDDANYELFRTVDDPGGPSWPTPEMYLLRVVEVVKRLRRADMPWLGSNTLILRDAAIDTVGPLLSEFGQLLPLLCADARLVFFAADPLPGAIDIERSEIVRFKDGSGIMDIKRAVFNDEVVSGRGAFKLPEMPRGDVYLTEKLVSAIRATGHDSGTEFKLMYDSDAV